MKTMLLKGQKKKMNEIEILEAIEEMVEVWPSLRNRLSRFGLVNLKYLPILRAKLAAKKLQIMLEENKFPKEYIKSDGIFLEYIEKCQHTRTKTYTTE